MSHLITGLRQLTMLDLLLLVFIAWSFYLTFRFFLPILFLFCLKDKWWKNIPGFTPQEPAKSRSPERSGLSHGWQGLRVGAIICCLLGWAFVGGSLEAEEQGLWHADMGYRPPRVNVTVCQMPSPLAFVCMRAGWCFKTTRRGRLRSWPPGSDPFIYTW